MDGGSPSSAESWRSSPGRPRLPTPVSRKKQKICPRKSLPTIIPLCLSLTTFTLSASATAAPSRVIVEVGVKAEQLVEPRFTRRLIELEVGYVDVMPDPVSGRANALFTRVLATREGGLRVELWERGELHGARTVSGKGNPQLAARRVALAVAELARRLHHRRAALARRLEVERAASRARTAAAAQRRHVITLDAGVTAALLSASGSWLVGPSVGFGVKASQGPRVGFALGLMQGRAPVVDSSLEWLELRFEPGYRWPIDSDWAFDAGVVASAATVHTPRAELDDLRGQHQSWSARAAAQVGLVRRLGPRARLVLSPEVGVVLRGIPAASRSDGRERIGGPWLGASLAIELDLAPRVAAQSPPTSRKR